MTMTMATAVFVAVIPCHSVERKGENPDPNCGAHFECSRQLHIIITIIAAFLPLFSLGSPVGMTSQQALTPHLPGR